MLQLRCVRSRQVLGGAPQSVGQQCKGPVAGGAVTGLSSLMKKQGARQQGEVG